MKRHINLIIKFFSVLFTMLNVFCLGFLVNSNYILQREPLCTERVSNFLNSNHFFFDNFLSIFFFFSLLVLFINLFVTFSNSNIKNTVLFRIFRIFIIGINIICFSGSGLLFLKV